MAQTVSKSDMGGAAPRLFQIRALLGSGVCALALSVALANQDARAQGWQETTEYYPGGYTTTFTWLRWGDGRIINLETPAPANRCPALAFEVLNPKRGEPRCVGHVPPYSPP